MLNPEWYLEFKLWASHLAWTWPLRKSRLSAKFTQSEFEALSQKTKVISFI